MTDALVCFAPSSLSVVVWWCVVCVAPPSHHCGVVDLLPQRGPGQGYASQAAHRVSGPDDPKVRRGGCCCC